MNSKRKAKHGDVEVDVWAERITVARAGRRRLSSYWICTAALFKRAGG